MISRSRTSAPDRRGPGPRRGRRGCVTRHDRRRSEGEQAGPSAEGVARCEQVLPDLPVGWGDRMRHMIDKGDIDSLNKAAVEYASRLESSSGGEFRSFLRDFVASLQVVDPGVIRALDDLGVPLTTINVDDLIERVTGRPPVTSRDPDRMARAVRGDEPGVAHLYGYWEDPESIIPGLSDFERGSGSHLLGEASRGKLTCLFVGCSDIAGDPLLLSLLRRANPPDRESVRHVLLARDSEAGTLGHASRPRTGFPSSPTVIPGQTWNPSCAASSSKRISRLVPRASAVPWRSMKWSGPCSRPPVRRVGVRWRSRCRSRPSFGSSMPSPGSTPSSTPVAEI